MKSNVTALPSDTESLRRLVPEFLELISTRLNSLKQRGAPMLPQEALPIEKFVSVVIDEAERSVVIQLGYVKFAIRFKTAGHVRTHHNSHTSREVAAFQVVAFDSETEFMSARFRVVVIRATDVPRITRWAHATKPLIGELVNAIIEVYRRFVLESHTLDTELAGVVVFNNSISMKYNLNAAGANEHSRSD